MCCHEARGCPPWSALGADARPLTSCRLPWPARWCSSRARPPGRWGRHLHDDGRQRHAQEPMMMASAVTRRPPPHPPPPKWQQRCRCRCSRDADAHPPGDEESRKKEQAATSITRRAEGVWRQGSEAARCMMTVHVDGALATAKVWLDVRQPRNDGSPGAAVHAH